MLLSGKESACQGRRHRRCGLDFWVRKIPWRRKWQPTPVFLPEKSHGQRSLVATVHGVVKDRTRLSDWVCPRILFDSRNNSMWWFCQLRFNDKDIETEVDLFNIIIYQVEELGCTPRYFYINVHPCSKSSCQTYQAGTQKCQNMGGRKTFNFQDSKLRIFRGRQN